MPKWLMCSHSQQTLSISALPLYISSLPLGECLVRCWNIILPHASSEMLNTKKIILKFLKNWRFLFTELGIGVAQKIQNIYIVFVKCRTNVEDVGQTLYKWYINVFVFAGSRPISIHIHFNAYARGLLPFVDIFFSVGGSTFDLKKNSIP